MPLVQAQQVAIYQLANEDPTNPRRLRLLAGYARHPNQPVSIPLGDGLLGQCAMEKRTVLLKDVPPQYTRISSSLGEAPPSSIVVLPVLFEGHIKAVIELASLHPFSATNLIFLEQLTQSIGVVAQYYRSNDAY